MRWRANGSYITASVNTYAQNERLFVLGLLNTTIFKTF